MFNFAKGYVAYRNPEMGSWYCSALVTVLADHASDLCLIDILRMVSDFNELWLQSYETFFIFKLNLLRLKLKFVRCNRQTVTNSPLLLH